MIRNNQKKVILALTLIIFLVLLFAVLFYINPEELVEKIGVRNGYILAFLISFFGGFSAGGFVPFISVILTLVAGGLNPVLLGLIAGTSLSTGDIIMFYASSKGRELVAGSDLDRKIDKLSKKFRESEKLQKATPIIAYLYMGFAPLPNDVLLLTLAAVEYPIKKMNKIIILADMTFALGVTILGSRGLLFFI